ncbi:MAG: phosphoadenylyl-sulfate reductase [Flavobacteriales bacterium]
MPTFEAFRDRVHAFQAEGRTLFASTSFQGHSVPMLHMLSRIDAHIPVYYVDTGYLFPETLRFRDVLKERLGLQFIGLRPAVPKSQQRDASGALMYTWDPDRCCHLNKVQPLERVLAEYDVWLNGVRADQSAARKAMQVEQPAGFGCLRYHPMLDWNARMVFEYRKKHELPEHPLEAEGYGSIGCEPCTRKLMDGYDERTSRWFGLNKTECGLNTELVQETPEDMNGPRGVPSF